MSQQSKWLQQQYHDIGATLAEQSPVALLHIGSQQTLVMISESSVLTLPLGANKTAADYFSHSIPKADEMENAIMAVEDRIMAIRAQIPANGRLLTVDEEIHHIALLAGVADQQVISLSLDAMERTFDRLAAVMLGRPAAREGIPEDASFAARLLILREFMHHLAFAEITIVSPDSLK